ncbi:protein DEHYDRATION-INDUCED 19 homolog 4-like, partial [Carica papaya]|uniref:protein DEHYDRATION-INDUCED 19 homolog 4-like n=1 Tax=Carica papaya TaxID=3649 RepID=UPI000B8C75DA
SGSDYWCSLCGGGYDETEGDRDLKSEFLCPFCAEEFHVVCRIDEAKIRVNFLANEITWNEKTGVQICWLSDALSPCFLLYFHVCPVCAKRVGADIVSHVTLQHGSFFLVQRKRRLRKGGSNLTFSMLRKELREANSQPLHGDHHM